MITVMINISTTCGCQRSAVATFPLKILSPKRGIILAKMNSKLSPLFVHISLFIGKIYFEFEVYMFSNGRDMTKCHKIAPQRRRQGYNNTSVFLRKQPS